MEATFRGNGLHEQGQGNVRNCYRSRGMCETGIAAAGCELMGRETGAASAATGSGAESGGGDSKVGGSVLCDRTGRGVGALGLGCSPHLEPRGSSGLDSGCERSA